MTATAHIDGGSFRDPSGEVIHLEGQVYRRVSHDSVAPLRKLEASGLLKDLIAKHLIIETRFVEPSEAVFKTLTERFGSNSDYLWHKALTFVTYPYEWTRSMVADAASLHLKLQIALTRQGFSLKDASAFNIQFENSTPVFIDIPSIEIPPRFDAWVAYGQFCRMFLFPLALGKYVGVDTKGYYLSNIDGMDVEAAYRILGPWKSLRPRLFVDVFLQAHMHRYATSRAGVPGKPTRDGTGQTGNPDSQILNLARLMGVCEKMQTARKAGVWADYAQNNSYSSAAEKQKMEFVDGFMQEHAPKAVLDIGCNTGNYSVLAARRGAWTMGIDADHDAVDSFYNQVKGTGLPVTPLWIDLANPSPGTGFRNRERKSFLERAKFDAVFALALMHHLLVTSRIPLPAMRDLMADLTGRWLVIEFVSLEDPMFQTLLKLRENIYGYLTRDLFEKVFAERFRLVKRSELDGTRRTMYVFEKL